MAPSVSITATSSNTDPRAHLEEQTKTMVPSVRSMLAQSNGRIRLCESHDRSSTEIISHTAGDHGQFFDGIWYSGLCQTTDLGIPDTELISPLQRATLLALKDNLQERGTRPLCAAFDADSGGDVADAPALVSTLALMGVSMVIIEDKAVSKPGRKVNSLKDTSSLQSQADMYEFSNMIRAYKSASTNTDMMITARIESFTVRGAKKDEAEERASVQEALSDALQRAQVYHEAGVDAIMIHSKSADPSEVLSFLTHYRSRDAVTPLVVVPTAYSATARTTLYNAGANVIIYANHLMRAKISALGCLSDKILAEDPSLFSGIPQLRLALEARNFGCLLRKLWERRSSGEESKEAQVYRIAAAAYATDNMKAVVKRLLEGERSGCEADDHILPVKDLLRINTHQVSSVDELVG